LKIKSRHGSAFFCASFLQPSQKLKKMKKLLLTFSTALMIFSCTESEKIPANSGKISENSEKNEMVALMDRMMDDMHSDKPTGNIDADFANMMIAHHQGAVDMSQLLLEKGKD